MSAGANDLDYLISRGKKMAGKLGHTPTPLEIQERFKKNGTDITMDQARSIHDAVDQHRKVKDGRAPVSERRGTRTKEKPRVKAELAPAPRQKSETRWGR